MATDRGRRLRDARWVRKTVWLLAVLLLAGWGAIAMVRDLARLMATEARGPVTTEEPALMALARCEGSLAEARGQVSRDPVDAGARLRVASLELRRAELLALVAYTARHGPDWRHVFKPPPDTAGWRARFLRGDPGGCLTRASDAARAAVACEQEVPGRLKALELLAAARSGLGDHEGEAEALDRAIREEPQNAALWLRLAEACGRARHLARAETARARALALMEREETAR
jgi:hypothetical protein